LHDFLRLLIFLCTTQYRGIPSEFVLLPENDRGHPSSAWVYRATGNETYLNMAKTFYDKYDLAKTPDGHRFSWDQKNVGCQVLLAQLAPQSNYLQPGEKYCREIEKTTGPDVSKDYFQNINNFIANQQLIFLAGNYNVTTCPISPKVFFQKIRRYRALSAILALSTVWGQKYFFFVQK
jgi:hypothetical protein